MTFWSFVTQRPASSRWAQKDIDRWDHLEVERWERGTEDDVSSSFALPP